MSWFKGLLHYQSKITHQACYSIRIRHLETWLPGPKWYLISKSLNYSFQLFTKSAKYLFKENKTKPSSGLIIKQFSALRILLATLCGGNWLLSSTTPAPVVQIKWLYFSKRCDYYLQDLSYRHPLQVAVFEDEEPVILCSAASLFPDTL